MSFLNLFCFLVHVMILHRARAPTSRPRQSLLLLCLPVLLLGNTLLVVIGVAAESTPVPKDHFEGVGQCNAELGAQSPLELHFRIFQDNNTLGGRSTIAACAIEDRELEKAKEASDRARPGLDEEKAVEENEFAPWSFRPTCTEFLADVGESGSELCVFTDRVFENGRGISIFTTPQIAAEFAERLASLAKQQLDGQDDQAEDEQPTYTQAVPGKGIGMRARRQLQRGDRITAARPALLAHMESALSTPTREHFLRIALEQLPPKTREAYYDLAKIYGQESVIAQDVVKANAFEMEIGGRMHLAVFPEPSRINHACGPNAQYFLNATHLTHYVHATRPIARDEEISISYSYPFWPAEQRQQHLLQSYGFTCACSRCTSGASSNNALNEIEKLTEDLKDWTTQSSGTPQKAEKLIQLYEQEGLQGFVDVAYGYASVAYNAVGDEQHAKMFARLAADAVLLKDGPAAQTIDTWKEIIEHPQTHWSWNWRKRR